MNVLEGYVLVKKISGSSIHMSRQYIDEYQRCKVVHPNTESPLKKGDEILVAENTFFEKADELKKDTFLIYEDEVYGVVREGVIQPMKNMVYIKIDKEKKSKIGNIHVDTRYNPYNINNRVQDGEILSVCKKAENSYFLHELEINVKPGDKVYTHHFIVEPSNEREFNGSNYYEIRYEDLYCKVNDDEITMLNDWNLVTPVKRDAEVTESGIVLEVGEKDVMVTAIMQHPNKDSGLYPGDKILFRKGREYKINVEGHIYYRIPNDSIYYNLDKMKAHNNIVVVEPMRKESKIGNIYVGNTKEEVQLPEKGKVAAVSENNKGNLKEGDIILFRKAASTHVEIEGKEYMLMDMKNIYVTI